MLRRTFLAALIVSLSATTSHSGHSCCSQCGCSKMKKICVPVCEMVKETSYEYSCVCEDFCVPGPSKCVGHKCVTDCQGCSHCVKVMQPTCGHVQTRTKLVKTPVTKEKCSTKWVIKTVCCGCGHSCGGCAEGCGPNCTDCTTPAPADQAAALIPPPPAIETPTPSEGPAEATTMPSRLFR